MKVDRKKLVKLLQDNDIKTSVKGKPVSSSRLLELAKEHIDTLTEGDDVDPLAASLSAAFESDAKVKIIGDDPTVAKQAAKPEKSEKPAKAEKAEKAKKSSKEEKPKAKKSAAVRDKWNSSPDSSAGQINSVFFANKGKGLTIDQIIEALGSEEVTRTRVRDHLRRLVTDGILDKDAKDRYKPTGSTGKPKEE